MKRYFLASALAFVLFPALSLAAMMQFLSGRTGAINATGAPAENSGETMHGSIDMNGLRMMSAEFPFLENVTGYGAKCDGLTDDTAAFTSAWRAATATYLATGSPVKIIYGNTCVIGKTAAVIGGSGAHWDGSYGRILVPVQMGFVFEAQSANDVAFDNIRIDVISNPGGNNAIYSAIYWQSLAGDAANHFNFAVRNSIINNSGWGIFVQNGAGTGLLTNVDLSGNTVTSPTIYSNGDGIHVEGNVSNTTISNNHVSNRGDACIALVSIPPPFRVSINNGPSVVTGNSCLNDQVNLDDSGASNVIWNNNYVSSTTPVPRVTSGMRVIYFGASPTNITIAGNYFHVAPGTDANVKFDTINGATVPPDANITFTGNTIASYSGNSNAALYIRANRVSVISNTFLDGATLLVDYDGPDHIPTQNVLIGSNDWLGNGTINMGANSSLNFNVQIVHQNVVGTLIAPNLIYSVIPNGQSQVVTATGCVFVNNSNGSVCKQTLTLPQMHTDRHYNVVCSSLSSLGGTVGSKPLITLTFNPTSSKQLVVYEQATIGSSAGYATSNNYGITLTCTTLHP